MAFIFHAPQVIIATRNFPLPRFRDLSRAYEKRTRAVMEKYTTGTQPLRRQSGCKEEENPYATCADSFTDATFRHVVYQGKKVASRPFANRVGTNKPARCTSFLFRHRRRPLFYDFYGLSRRTPLSMRR